MGKRDLSSYAFNTYGSDAKLYNGIHDLETLVALLQDALQTLADEAAESSLDKVRVNAALDRIKAARGLL